jgi:hypothetical protein
MTSDDTLEWTTVGKKKFMSKNKPTIITPSDVYYTNTVKVKDKNTIIDGIVNTIMDQTKGSSNQESIDVLSNIVVFAINALSTVVNKVKTDVSNINDDQKTVIALNTWLEHIGESHTTINVALSTYEENMRVMELMKKSAIGNIQKFLTTCGIDEKKHIETDTVSDCEDTSVTCLPVDNIRRSYASSIGATISDLVVNKQHMSVDTTNNHKIMIADTGIVYGIPVISKANDCMGFTISYIDSSKVFVIRMGDTIFTVGPGNFVNLNNTSNKTKHAKRCLNTHPCQSSKCKYYHDPCVMGENFNGERNFALSYVLQMLGYVKNPTDIEENKIIRSPCFIRDLVQLGGIILFKAAQIKDIHFKGKKI